MTHWQEYPSSTILLRAKGGSDRLKPYKAQNRRWNNIYLFDSKRDSAFGWFINKSLNNVRHVLSE